MIQIVKNEATIVKVRLNPERLDVNSSFDFVVNSPSRGTLSFQVSLNEISTGVYSFALSDTDTVLLEDDTYFYEINQGLNTLKTGVIRLTLSNGIQGEFDYTLDLILA